ncbi:MAG: hypothetical protein KGL39_42805 [Patescibacteria group bacterium]|nr:hypothetical protein [Patescibacteria group bacterium]
MTNDIYQQFDAAFRNVSAYAVLREGKLVARICFKYGSAVTAFVHWYGLEMQRGQARGGGYDRASAACAAAASKIVNDCYGTGTTSKAKEQALCAKFKHALENGPDGMGWETWLRAEGFEIVNMIA